MTDIITTVPVVNVDDFLSAVDSRLSDRWGLGCDDYTETHEWAREDAIRCLLEGMTAEQTADEIGSNYEPSDAEMVAYNPVGTAWHDGCR